MAAIIMNAKHNDAVWPSNQLLKSGEGLRLFTSLDDFDNIALPNNRLKGTLVLCSPMSIYTYVLHLS